MSQKSIQNLALNSIILNNNEYKGQTAFVYQENILTTNNTGTLLVNGLPISSSSIGITAGSGITVTESPTDTFQISNDGVLELTAGDNITITGTKNNYTINSIGGGGGSVIESGQGIDVVEDPVGTFTIDNTGVTTLTASNGLSVDMEAGDVTITNTGVLSVTEGTGITITETPVNSGTFEISSTVNPDDFQTVAAMSDYSTTTEANLLYQPVGSYQTTEDMADYSTTLQADALYQTNFGSIGFGQFTFPSQTIQPGIVESTYIVSLLPAFQANANSVVVMQNNSSNATLNIRTTIRWGGNANPSNFILDVANFSDTALVVTFPFSVIAFNP